MDMGAGNLESCDRVYVCVCMSVRAPAHLKEGAAIIIEVRVNISHNGEAFSLHFTKIYQRW